MQESNFLNPTLALVTKFTTKIKSKLNYFNSIYEKFHYTHFNKVQGLFKRKVQPKAIDELKFLL